MLTAVLASHADLENRLLFSSIESLLAPIGPVQVIRLEHDQIENGLAQIQQNRTAETASDILLEVISIARAHRAGIFFIGAQRISAETLNNLGGR